MIRAAASLMRCSLALALVPAGAALAQDVFPSTSIKFVVPFPPGSGTDTSARQQ